MRPALAIAMLLFASAAAPPPEVPIPVPAPRPPAEAPYPPGYDLIPRPPVAPDYGVRNLGLGSNWQKGPDGTIQGVCPTSVAPSGIGSVTLAPLIPPMPLTGTLSPELGIGVSPGVPIYGSTYGENLGGGQGSTLAQSSAVLGTPCPTTHLSAPLPQPPLELPEPPAISQPR